MKGKPNKKDLEFLASFGTRRAKPQHEEVNIGEMLVELVEIYKNNNWNVLIQDFDDALVEIAKGYYDGDVDQMMQDIENMKNTLQPKVYVKKAARLNQDKEASEKIRDYEFKRNIAFDPVYN